MVMTSAQRQARYRDRRKYEDDAPIEGRLNMMLYSGALTSLKQLARHHNTTQKALLEQLLKDTENDLLDDMNGREQRRYWRRF